VLEFSALVRQVARAVKDVQTVATVVRILFVSVTQIQHHKMKKITKIAFERRVMILVNAFSIVNLLEVRLAKTIVSAILKDNMNHALARSNSAILITFTRAILTISFFRMRVHTDVHAMTLKVNQTKNQYWF